MAGYYYNDPSGRGSWWVADGETPSTAAANPNTQANIQRRGSQVTGLETALSGGGGQTVANATVLNTGNTGDNTTTAATGNNGLTDVLGGGQQPTTPSPRSQGNAAIRVKFEGNTYELTDPQKIGEYLDKGAEVVGPDNVSTYTPKKLNGGYLINYGGDVWLPVDTILNGQITQAQKDALIKAGYTVPDGLNVIPGGTTGTGTTNGTGASGGGGTTNGTGGIGGTQLSGDLQKMLKDLMQRSLDQGTAGQDALKSLIDEFKKNADYNQGQSEANTKRRDELVNQLLGGDTGLATGYDKAIANMGNGLDPTTMASLNQQAIEGPQRDYQGQVESLKTSLAGRGAYGGGDTPGSFGDIIRGYAPLMTSRDTTRQGLLQNASFENQNQKNFNFTSGLNALSGKGSLLGTLGGIYNPNASQGFSQSALNSALSGINASNQTGFQGINTAGNLGGVLNDTNTGSLSSILKSSLLGTGLNALTTKTDKGKSILGSLISLIPGLGGGGKPGGPDYRTALEDYLDNSVGPSWRQYINSDQIDQLLGELSGSKTPV